MNDTDSLTATNEVTPEVASPEVATSEVTPTETPVATPAPEQPKAATKAPAKAKKAAAPKADAKNKTAKHMVEELTGKKPVPTKAPAKPQAKAAPVKATPAKPVPAKAGPAPAKPIPAKALKTTIEATKGNLGARMRELINLGLDNDAIWAVVEVEYSLSDNKKSYVQGQRRHMLKLKTARP